MNINQQIEFDKIKELWAELALTYSTRRIHRPEAGAVLTSEVSILGPGVGTHGGIPFYHGVILGGVWGLIS